MKMVTNTEKRGSGAKIRNEVLAERIFNTLSLSTRERYKVLHAATWGSHGAWYLVAPEFGLNPSTEAGVFNALRARVGEWYRQQ